MKKPAAVAALCCDVGVDKSKTPPVRLLCLGLMAGIFVALAGTGAAMASCTLSNPGLSKLIAGLLFPGGLAMVMIAGSELFTGDCLMSVALLEKRITLLSMLRCWAIVYLGNLLGGLLIVWLLAAGGTFSSLGGAFALSAVKTAAAKCALPFGQAVALGVLCNLLVSVAVWMGFAGETVADKLFAIYLPIALFVVCGFEHCVANMYYIPAGIFALRLPGIAEAAAAAGISVSSISIEGFLLRNLLPVTLGNILGGSVLIGAVYHFIYLSSKTKDSSFTN